MAEENVETGTLPITPGQQMVRPNLVERARTSPWWMLVMLTVLLIASSVDQGGLGLLVNPIRADLGLSDVQISLLMGFAFIVVKATLLLPAGYMVDRFNRRILLSNATAAWSAISALTGFVGSFGQLFLARSGLAAAEASMMPAAHSMIRDAFPPRQRGLAYSIFLSAAGVSGSISLLVAGALISASDRGFFHDWPIIGHFKNWQIVLAFPGVCTLPLALVMLSVREPARRVATAIKGDLATTRDAVRYIWDHRWVYGPVFLTVIVTGYGNYALQWMPTALIRGWGISAAAVAHITGGIGLGASLLGIVVSGFLMDLTSRKRIVDGPLRVYLIAMAATVCCNLSALHMREPWMIYTLLGLGQFFYAGHYAALSITLASITPSRLMGRTIALYFLSLGLFGGPTWSPTVTALVAKYCYHGPMAIVPALNAVLVVAAPMGLCIGLFAASRVARFSRLYRDGVD